MAMLLEQMLLIPKGNVSVGRWNNCLPHVLSIYY